MNPERQETISPKNVPFQPVPTPNQQSLQSRMLESNQAVPDAFQKVAAWNHYNAVATPPIGVPQTARPPSNQSPHPNPPGYPYQSHQQQFHPLAIAFQQPFGLPQQVIYPPPPPGFTPHRVQVSPVGLLGPPGFFPQFAGSTTSQGNPSEVSVRTKSAEGTTGPIAPSITTKPTSTIQVAPPRDPVAPTTSSSGITKKPENGEFSLVKTISGHTKSVSVIKFSYCGKYLGTGSADKQIKVWNTVDMTYLQTLASHQLGINDFSWSSNSQFIASASDDTTVKIFDVISGACLRTMRGHTNYVFCCSFNPQSSLIASAGFDETVRVWDFKTGLCVKCIPAHSDPITSISYNHDGNTMATSSYDGCIRVWDAASGSCLKTLVDTDHAPVTFVCFSPNGKYLLSAQLDSSLKLWDPKKAKPLKYYNGHKNKKYCLFANMSVPLGKHIISGSEDGRILVWSIQTKQIVQILEGHTTPVLATDSHPTLNIIASGGLEPDNVIRIWRRN